ncbi:IS110 family transposase [Rhodococcus sp. DMU1]|uniref:IS110 family transposase n=1 Tax=Rhodococcus sp. DMU1 TaxID=2722825 RepID=UPI00143EF049|nr:IS110 family transposase [Rhodococcus sp. DMU1]QIX53705.1 IS110 family transposase [Rhodococcus sp. DMU1]
MEVVHERCAGMDISKRDAKVCIRTPGARPGTYRKQLSVHGAMRRDIAALREHLLAAQVTLVVMEATGDYWKPFYYALEDDLNLMLVNARHAKNLPGRKTDVSDAQWLTELAAHGLVRGSFIPPWPIRRLRDLTRQRTLLTTQKTRETQRLEKLIESTGIKYTSVTTRTLGVSGRAFLEALIAGETSPLVLAGLARGRLKNKTGQLRLALDGNFTNHHGQLVGLYLDRIDVLDRHITALTRMIDTLVTDYDLAWARGLLVTVPGLSTTGAENILAETGVDMTAFETPAHLASWAGVCPGQHESAGRSGPGKTRPGNAHLKGALGIAAMAAARTNGSFFQQRYRRLSARRGPTRALVAVEHSLLVAIWHILTDHEPYRPHRPKAA